MRTDPSTRPETRTRPRVPVGPFLVLVGALAGLTAVAGPPPAAAQERGLREVVSKQIEVGRDEAALRLEFSGSADAFEVRLEDGRVLVDGEEIGRFDESGGLASAWRELLGRAIQLDDGPLARALASWNPPSDLEGDALELATRIDRSMEEALALPEVMEDVDEGTAQAGAATDEADELVRSLLGQTRRLSSLGAALEGLDLEDIQVVVGENYTVAEEVELDASLLVVGGDVDIRGEVRGNVVVLDGTLRTFPGSRITGDVRLVDGWYLQEGGDVDGDVVDVDDVGAVVERDVREEIRSELRNELRRELRRELRGVSNGGWTDFGPIRNVTRGLGDLIGLAFQLLILSALGGLVLFLGRDNLEVVAETARRTPGRAAAVGLAGAFLSLPVWVLGAVALCISLIGIPVAIAWLPLFPLAVLLAAALGYYAVAYNVGGWLVSRRYPYTDWIRRSNPVTLVVGGLTALMAAYFLANVFEMVGFLGFFEGLLTAAGVVVSVGAVLVGFGAVLLTRAGRRPEYFRAEADPFDDLDDWGWDPDPGPGPGGAPTGDPFAPSGGTPGGARADTGGGTTGSTGATGATGAEGASGSAGSAGPADAEDRGREQGAP